MPVHTPLRVSPGKPAAMTDQNIPQFQVRMYRKLYMFRMKP